jgi:hypothetical protein
MAFFAKRSEAPDPYPPLDPIEPIAPAAEPGMSPMLAKVLGMLGFDAAQLELMAQQMAAVMKDVEQRLTRIEAKLDELLIERRAVHAALQNGKAQADKNDART